MMTGFVRPVGRARQILDRQAVTFPACHAPQPARLGSGGCACLACFTLSGFPVALFNLPTGPALPRAATSNTAPVLRQSQARRGG